MALTVVFGLLIHFIRAMRRGRLKEPEVVPDPLEKYASKQQDRETFVMADDNCYVSR
jgi:hypothetical protein